MQKAMDVLVGSCAETREQLSERMEGELPGLRRLRVAAHLAGCEACRALLRSLTRTVEQVRTLGQADFAPPPDGSVADDVVERIRHEHG